MREKEVKGAARLTLHGGGVLEEDGACVLGEQGARMWSGNSKMRELFRNNFNWKT